MKCSFEFPGLLRLAQAMSLAATVLSSIPVAVHAQAPSIQPPQSAPQAQPKAAPFPQNAPEHKMGVFESFGRWFDESATNMRKGFDDAWKGMGNVGNTTADVAKGTADAAGAVTKGAVDAAKGTADAFGKLGASRVVSGRERCAIAPNGAASFLLLARFLGSRSRRWRHNSAGSQISHQVSVDLVAMHDHVQIGVAHSR